MNQSMNRLGNLEEMILLLVLYLEGEAYGVKVREAYLHHYEQQISLSAVHTVLRRLEEKALTTSKMDGATAERGGRRKRIYEITPFGQKTLSRIQDERLRIWNLIDELKIKGSPS